MRDGRRVRETLMSFSVLRLPSPNPCAPHLQACAWSGLAISGCHHDHSIYHLVQCRHPMRDRDRRNPPLWPWRIRPSNFKPPRHAKTLCLWLHPKAHRHQICGSCCRRSECTMYSLSLSYDTDLRSSILTSYAEGRSEGRADFGSTGSGLWRGRSLARPSLRECMH